MTTHVLKTDPEVFAAVLAGVKTHEIRLNDRGFAVGDKLLLRETKETGWTMATCKMPVEYTGRTTERIVSHIQTGYGLADAWCILSFATEHAAIQPAGDAVPFGFVSIESGKFYNAAEWAATARNQELLASGKAVRVFTCATPPASPVQAKAEQDSGCRMTGGICACRSGGSFGGCAKERADCCTSEPARPAATEANSEASELPGTNALIEAGALRQLRHNDGSDGFVFAYDKEITDRVFASLRARQPVAAPSDAMDWPLPCDVTVGAGTIGKGCKLRTLVARTRFLHHQLMEATEPTAPSAAPVAQGADSAAERDAAPVQTTLHPGRQTNMEAAIERANTEMQGFDEVPVNTKGSP